MELENISVQILEQQEDIALLKDDWDNLHNSSSCASIYNSYDFIYTAICSFGESHTRIQIFTLKDKTTHQLLAIFPLQCVSKRIFGGLAHSVYKYTALEEVDKPFPVIRDGFSAICWQAFIAFMKHFVSDWQTLQLIEMPIENPDLEQLLNICSRNKLIFRVRDDQKGPIVNLRGNWDNFWSQHKKMRKKIRKMERDFAESLEFKVYEDNKDWEWCLEQYIKLERKSWKNQSNIAISQNEKKLTFYRELFKRLGNTGRLYFGFLSIDKALVSAEIAYTTGNKVYFAHGCYDEEYSNYSPGMVSTSLFLKYFFGKGYTQGDYLCGYSGYLNAWSDSILKTCEITIVNKPLELLMIKAFYRLRQFSKKVFKKSTREHYESKNYKYDKKASTYNIEIIPAADADSIDKQAWNELSEHSLYSNPFYERWNLLPALHHFQQTDQVYIVLLKANDRLIGLFPVQINLYMKFIRFTSMWSHNHCYLTDPLLSEDLDFKHIASLVNQHLQTKWLRLPIHTRSLINYGENIHFNLFNRAGILSTQPFPCFQHHQGKFNRENRRLLKKLESAYLVNHLEHQDPKGLERYIELEHKGWKGSSNSSIASNVQEQNYYQEMVNHPDAKNKVFFQELWADNQLIAMNIRLTSHKYWYDIKNSYNDDFKQYAPGRLIELKNILKLKEQPFEVLDSCTSPDNYLINKIWPDRLALQRTLVFHSSAASQFWLHVYRIKRQLSTLTRK